MKTARVISKEVAEFKAGIKIFVGENVGSSTSFKEQRI